MKMGKMDQPKLLMVIQGGAGKDLAAFFHFTGWNRFGVRERGAEVQTDTCTGKAEGEEGHHVFDTQSSSRQCAAWLRGFKIGPKKQGLQRARGRKRKLPSSVKALLRKQTRPAAMRERGTRAVVHAVRKATTEKKCQKANHCLL